MSAVFRPYCGQKGITEDYMRVHDFLVRINRDKPVTPNFPWGRWAWMFCLECFLDTEHLNRIGVWEDKGEIVALVTYEAQLGEARFLVDERYDFLKEEMLLYASSALEKDGKLSALIPDSDAVFQNTAAQLGFFATQNYEPVSVLPLDTPLLPISLPDGFSLVSLEEEYDLKKYNRVLHRGFNHEGDAPETEEALTGRKMELSGPYTDLSLKIAVKAPNGEFTAYCGMWYLEGTTEALVEPVATDPQFRRMGLGKAAVLEACRRCALRGAKTAYVGSSQQFYYTIGFRPYSKETWWERKGSK